MKFYYLIRFQYLGFRYHGWLKQSAKRTVQETLEDVLHHLLPEENFQVIGASRTDSMVSAQESFFELITEKEVIHPETLSIDLNKFLPPDIRILGIRQVDSQFKIISSSKTKEYHYYFSFGEKLHPFCAPFMAMINEDLDLELMKSAARLFEGEHDFSHFCYRKKEGQSAIRLIDMAAIETNRELTANFFPSKSFVFKVRAKSFLRHQIRLMMGALFLVGMKKLSLVELEELLKGNGPGEKKLMTAPASGLVLKSVLFSVSV